MKTKQFIKILDKLGFKFIHQKGSHMFFMHDDGRTTIVPNHPTENLDRNLMNKIIKHDIGISRDDFMELV